MTPRQRVECVLKGGRADRIPFTVYERKLPQCTAERELRSRGLCIVNRSVPVVRIHQPNVKVTTTQFSEQGRSWIRTVYETPVGSVSTLQEPAEIMHRRGKLIGCHFDGQCGSIRAAIAETPLDYIEAFTPAPDTDMTLAEARAAWPGKVLWINFPSSLHLRSDADVEAATVGLLGELGNDPDGFIMEVTEDVPEGRWRDSFRAIMNGLDRVQG